MKNFLFYLVIVLCSFSAPSQNLAQTWSAPKRLTWNAGKSYLPSLAARNSVIHVTWHDDTPGNFEIFYKCSTDSGTTWAGTTRMTWNAGWSAAPSMATDIQSNVVHVVWNDDTPGNFEIFYKYSTDGGTTWSSLKRLTWNTGDSFGPSIQAEPNVVSLVWIDDTPGNEEIFFKRFDIGFTWFTFRRLTWNASRSTTPSLAIGNGHHVVWEDSVPGNREIFYKRSTDGGATWSSLTRLTWNAGISANPSISAIGNDINVVWHDDTPGNFEIFYKYSTDGGTTWSGLKRLTWNAGRSFLPSVRRHYGTHVVWEDDSTGNREIFYKHSSNNGATWTGSTRLTWNPGYSTVPRITGDPSYSPNELHLVWSDNSHEGPATYEIFYKIRK